MASSISQTSTQNTGYPSIALYISEILSPSHIPPEYAQKPWYQRISLSYLLEVFTVLNKTFNKTALTLYGLYKIFGNNPVLFIALFTTGATFSSRLGNILPLRKDFDLILNGSEKSENSQFQKMQRGVNEVILGKRKNEAEKLKRPVLPSWMRAVIAVSMILAILTIASNFLSIVAALLALFDSKITLPFIGTLHSGDCDKGTTNTCWQGLLAASLSSLFDSYQYFIFRVSSLPITNFEMLYHFVIYGFIANNLAHPSVNVIKDKFKFETDSFCYRHRRVLTALCLFINAGSTLAYALLNNMFTAEGFTGFLIAYQKSENLSDHVSQSWSNTIYIAALVELVCGIPTSITNAAEITEIIRPGYLTGMKSLAKDNAFKFSLLTFIFLGDAFGLSVLTHNAFQRKDGLPVEGVALETKIWHWILLSLAMICSAIPTAFFGLRRAFKAEESEALVITKLTKQLKDRSTHGGGIETVTFLSGRCVIKFTDDAAGIAAQQEMAQHIWHDNMHDNEEDADDPEKESLIPTAQSNPRKLFISKGNGLSLACEKKFWNPASDERVPLVQWIHTSPLLSVA